MGRWEGPDSGETKITRAEHIGAMVLRVIYIVGPRPATILSKACSKIRDSSKSLVERLVEYKAFAMSILSFVASIAAPVEAALKEEPHALQRLAAGPHNAISTPVFLAGSEIGLSIDVHGIHIACLAARFRVASRSNTLAEGFAKIQAARNRELVPLHVFSAGWE